MNKSLFPLFFIFLLLTLPFAAADSLSSILAHYETTKKVFEKTKQELNQCREIADNCDDLEEEMLDPAVNYAKAGIELMLAYLAYLDNPSATAAAQADLEQAMDDLQYVADKQDFDAAVSLAKTAWESVAVIVKQKTVEDLKEKISELVEKGKIIDTKLECGIGQLASHSSALDTTYKDFAAQIEAADKEIAEAENALANNGDIDLVIASIKSAQEALKQSQQPLATANAALTSEGGSLCTEVTIEEDVEETTAEVQEQEEQEQQEEQKDVDGEKEQDLDTLLDDYGLSDYYYDAKDAVETLTDYIGEKQDSGYDTSKAEAILAQAEDYFESGKNLVLHSSGTGALSKFLNAQQTAQLGLNSEYYKVGSSSSSNNKDYAAFVTCMEYTSYDYQRKNCYDEYGISDGTQEDIESCLDTASSQSSREACYADAEDEAEQQEDADAEELQSRIQTVEDDLDKLEDDVTALYDALSASGEDSTSDDYDKIDNAIDDLLDDVQAQREGFDQDIDDITALIDDEKYDDADNDLDDLEDTVDEYINDIQGEIDDIQQDVDAL